MISNDESGQARLLYQAPDASAEVAALRRELSVRDAANKADAARSDKNISMFEDTFYNAFDSKNALVSVCCSSWCRS